MFRIALVDASGGEKEVPSDVMTLRQERRPIVLLREALGRVELLERTRNVVEDAQRRRQSNSSGAFRSGRKIESQGFGKGGRRFPRSPQFEANPRIQKR